MLILRFCLLLLKYFDLNILRPGVFPFQIDKDIYHDNVLILSTFSSLLLVEYDTKFKTLSRVHLFFK